VTLAALQTFKNLPRPTKGRGVLTAAEFPNYSTCRIAKDERGLAYTLIPCSPTDDYRPLDVKIEQLEVRYGTPCSLEAPDGNVTEGLFTVIVCLSNEQSLVRHFLGVMSSLLDTVSTPSTMGGISDAVSNLIQLFRALTRPPKKATQGVWAELFLIATGAPTEVLASAWHATPEERYDFAMGTSRLEVKSSSSRQRIHHFSLEQLTPAPATTVVIVSVFVESSIGGVSLEDLIDQACETLPLLLQTKIRALVAETLGSNLASALLMRFDYELATTSVKYYNAISAPTIPQPLPAGVSAVQFSSDLTQSVEIDLGSIQDVALFAALPIP